MTVMRKLTLLLLCLALGIGVCDAKKKNRGVYFRTDAEIVLDKPYFGLNVSNMIQVVLEADRNPASVRVETENVPAEAVSVRVRRGELVLACDPGALSSKRKNDMSKRVVVYVGAAPLESFSLSGMSSVFSETEIGYGRMYGNERVRIQYSLQKPDDVCVGYVDLQRTGGMRGYGDGGGVRNEPGRRGFYVPGFGLYADRYVRL